MISKIVLPICEPANSHFKLTLPIKTGVNMLETNIDEVIENGTKDAAVAEPVKAKIVLIMLTIYNTSPILARDCPDNNNEKFLFNFHFPPIVQLKFELKGKSNRMVHVIDTPFAYRISLGGSDLIQFFHFT